MVARRSPAMTTPSLQAIATIVVPCGAISPPLACTTPVTRQQMRRGALEEFGERRHTGHAVRGR